jgi:hypothetical protein
MAVVTEHRTGEPPTQVFVSYRREDTQAHVPGLSTLLAKEFGRENVFRDVDTLGQVTGLYATHIDRMLASCHAVIVVIGIGWLDATDELGRRRLDDPADIHRQEIEAALRRDDVEVIPVLVDGAVMPASPTTDESQRRWLRRRRLKPELPPALARLAMYQAHELGHRRYADDVEDLIRKIDRARQQREEAERAARQAAGAAASEAAEQALITKAQSLAQGGEFEKARTAAGLIEDPITRVKAFAKISKVARQQEAVEEAEAMREALHAAVDQMVDLDTAREVLAEEQWTAGAAVKVKGEDQR